MFQYAACSGLLLVVLFGCAPGEEGGIAETVIQDNIRGTAYLGQQNWAEADASFRRALESRPEDPLLLTNRAVASIQLGETDQAVELLRSALAQDPTYRYAHYNLGLIKSRQGNYEPAVQHFEEVARADPEDLFTRYYLGSALARVDRRDEAVESYRAALSRDPSHVSSLYGLGRLLLQMGDQDEGARLINLSQEIRARSGLDEAVGTQYGEQGPYAMGIDYPGDVLPAPEPIPIAFEPIGRVQLEPTAPGTARAVLRAGEEGAPVLVVAQRATVLQLFPPGRSEPLAPPFTEGKRIVRLAAADVDNDGRVDLAALLQSGEDEGAAGLEPALLLHTAEGSLSPTDGGAFSGAPTTDAGGGLAGVDLVPVDCDHDGDLDLFWCWSFAQGSGCKLATNDGSGRFDVRDSGEHGFALEAGAPGRISVAFSDVDNDRDVDLLVSQPGAIHLFSNQRDGSFEEISVTSGLGPPASGADSLVVRDLNKDGWMDLLVSVAGEVRILVNRRGRFEAPAAIAAPPAGSAGGGDLAVADLDNDGFLDVLAGGEGGPVFYHNRGAGRWTTSADLLRAEGLGAGAAPLETLDIDGDGDLDVMVLDAAGTVASLRNDGGNANRAIALDTHGVGDNRFGIGTKVEVLAGALRQKYEITGPMPLHVGLGSRTEVQSARYLWPSGVLQDELDLEAGQVHEITQLDRKGTSCPLLYAWREDGWRFVTDFLGGCAIGYQHAPGVFSIPDTDEYVLVEGGLQEDRSGRLRLRLNNQLEEVIWFDQVELVVVDHPVGTRVYPNERLMPGPPFPGFELFASNDVRPVLSARAPRDGRDVSELLRERDRRYVAEFELLAPKGYAELHVLELDLGAFDPDERVVLLLDGWIDYADSSANVAAHQAGLRLVPPRLFVADGRDGWREIEGRMGFPAGLPKTMAVELSGLFNATDHRIRIETSMRIYWDRARVLLGGEETPLHVVRVQPSRAELSFGGYPAPTSPDGQKPHAYDPEDVADRAGWKAHVGAYTAFGDVTDLVARIDDRFVTTRHGDQMELWFPSPGPLRDGFVRTYLLYADGFGKDMDPNSAAHDEVGPIPFHGMPRYPYGEGVVPPVEQGSHGGGKRKVVPAPDGLHGVFPQPLLESDPSRR